MRGSRFTVLVRVACVVVCALVLAPGRARATHDGGESYGLLRVAPDGSAFLAARCNLNFAGGELGVFSSSGRKLFALVIEEEREGMTEVDTEALCGGGSERVEAYLASPTAHAKVRWAIQQWRLTARPVQALLAPGRSRVAFLTERKGQLQVVLVEGSRRSVLDSARLAGGCPSMRSVSGAVHWSPDGRTLIVAGSRVSSGDEMGCGWSAYLLTRHFPRPPRAPLSGRRAAEEANAEGFWYYKQEEHEEAARLYRLAVAFDPTYETAIYNAACMSAIAGDRAAALAGLRRLHTLATKTARKKLARAPADEDFGSLRADPEFQRLTAP